ncbi:MAG: TRAP transporter large permease [Proteobacteria bacterium]|nr:TRAP transporter large permease [Pseudomonadota bacterium]
MASFWMILSFFSLMALRVPICAAMGTGALVGLWLMGLPLNTIVRYMLHDVRSVPLLAIPFFVLAGNLMNQFDLTKRIFDFMGHVVSFFAGGLAQVNVITTCIFGGISGSALATIAGLGTMMIHAMTRAGYRAEFAAALTISTSLMDPLIPPSIMFIIYAVQMNVSVGHMFAAGVLPGLALCAVLLINNYILGRTGVEKFPVTPRSTLRDVGISAWKGFPSLMAPVIILRGMMTGLVTPTEASVLAVCYALILGALHREFSIPRFREAMVTSTRTTALIMYLTGVGSVMAFVLTSEQTAQHLAEALIGITDDKWMVLSLIVVALLVLGIFLETVPALLISVPLFGPLVLQFGIDPVHFGVVVTFALLLGIVHPPVGLGIFAVCAVTRLKMEPVIRATLLFYPALLITMLLIMFIPALSTWLPSVLFVK